MPKARDKVPIGVRNGPDHLGLLHCQLCQDLTGQLHGLSTSAGHCCQGASRQWYSEDRRLDSAHWDKGMCLGSPLWAQAGSVWADSRTHFTAQ